MYDNVRMDATQVELHNWPHDRGAGGRVAPAGDPINQWVVSRVHARYKSPKIAFDQRDDQGRVLKPRPELHAYLLDLDGSLFGLPDYEKVILCQMPPVGSWWIKQADDEYLARIERWREV
ncbi:hypothetical protein [Nonomuraea sp. NPDC049646]|uniref:hypothetical protein n=1 Tax=unclassified Nonomuraea TaxID=2593643 RepID=UPI00379638B8